MPKYMDSGGLSHLMTKIKAAIAATVTGVKGNAETSYRTGQVNITPANVGAVDKAGDTMTGMLTAPMIKTGNTVRNVVNCKLTTTVKETVVYTGVKYAFESHMPVVRLSGYAYGVGKTTELHIAFYVYKNEFYSSRTVTNLGAWNPNVYLFSYTKNNVEYVAIGLGGTLYYSMLSVDVQDELGGFANIETSGWTVTGYTDTGHIPAIGTNHCVSVSYGADILNPPKVNSHTVNSDVPANAVFTDTTYSAGTGLSLSGTTFSNSGVTGVKGNSESSYRTGNVNLTYANLGTVPAANGGTGQTNLQDSANALINALSTGTNQPEDNDYYVSQYAGGSQTTFHRRPVSALWNYIKGKMEFGGRNLLLNSGDLTKWNKEAGVTVTWDSTVGMYKIATSGKTSSRWGIYQDVTVDSGGNYTLSMDGATMDANHNFNPAFNAGTGWPANISPSYTATRARLSATKNLADGTTSIRVYIAAQPKADGDYVYAYRPKLEVGTMPSAWSPAPEDLVTGVKGNAESTYRTGQVNITPANVGAVAKSGDTMTGALTLPADLYTDDNSTCALNLRNSNIIGVNSIYTADKSDNSTEGIHFYRDATHVDSIHAKDGALFFTPNRQFGSSGTSYQIPHDYLPIHPEGNYAILPFANNDIAFLLMRGGSAVVTKDGAVWNADISNVFDGAPNYWAITSTGITTIVIELTLHRVFAWVSKVYVDFGSYWTKAVKIEAMYSGSAYPNDTWATKYDTTSNVSGHVCVAVNHIPVGASNAGVGFNKLRFTFSDFTHGYSASQFRIAQIGVVGYSSNGLREPYMSRGIDDPVLRSITPAANNTYSLGTSASKWANVYANTYSGGTFTDTVKFGSNTQSSVVDAGIRVNDVRSTTLANNSINQAANFYFTNTDMPTSNWWSLLHVKGWTGAYSAWELAGPAANADQRTEALYVRTGNASNQFGNWRKLFDYSQTLPIANGGTGATTASNALANLGAVAKSDELLTTNYFAPSAFKGPYISKIDNAFYVAGKRWTVTATKDGVAANSGTDYLFDGSYETYYTVNDGVTAVITMDFGNSYFPGYPYGYILVSMYYLADVASISARVYCNYSSQGIGWHDIAFTRIANANNQAILYRSGHQGYYNISKIEFTFVGKYTDSTYSQSRIAQIEMHLDRPSSARNPFVAKYAAETLYYDLTAPNFIGNLQGQAYKLRDTNNAHDITASFNKDGLAASSSWWFTAWNSYELRAISAQNAANSLLNALTTGDSDPVDNDYYISQYVNGGTTTTTYHRRPVSKLWNYMKSKISSWMKNNTSKGTLGWTSSTNDTMPITSNTLAYWDGSYTGNSSNLTYCVKGAFGTMATKNSLAATDIPAHASSATTYGAASTSNYGHAKLSSATNSSSEDLAATPKAVKAAYDLANTANTAAGNAMSAATGALYFKITYSISNGNVVGEAHVYSKGNEVTSQHNDSCFVWSYCVGTGSWVSLGTGKTKTVTVSSLGFGGNLKCDFTPASTS